MLCLPLDVSQILHENADHLGVLEDAPTKQDFFQFFVDEISPDEILERFAVFTLTFPFYKMLFMNRLEFSCFADFFVCIFKPEQNTVFFKIRN